MLIIILLVAALILTLLSLADWPPGASLRWLAVAVLLVIVTLFIGTYK